MKTLEEYLGKQLLNLTSKKQLDELAHHYYLGNKSYWGNEDNVLEISKTKVDDYNTLVMYKYNDLFWRSFFDTNNPKYEIIQTLINMG